MPVWPSRESWSSLTFRGFLWIVVGAIFVLSFLLYSPESSPSGTQSAPMGWLFRSWPALFAAAAAMWLLLNGPISAWPSWVQKACRVILVFFIYSGFLYLLRWTPFWRMIEALGFTSKNKETGVLILIATVVWMIATVRVIVPGGLRLPGFGLRSRLQGTGAPELKTARASVTFADVGGMEDAKAQIQRVVENRLKPGRFRKYGVERNGILLYGPRGSGKTFLAEATAGEFGLNFVSLSSPSLLNMWVGNTEANIRSAFGSAAARTPALLFIDEIDALGAARDTGISPGTWNRGYNNITIQVMQSIDQYRGTPGLVIMAATNALDSLDPAL